MFSCLSFNFRNGARKTKIWAKCIYATECNVCCKWEKFSVLSQLKTCFRFCYAVDDTLEFWILWKVLSFFVRSAFEAKRKKGIESEHRVREREGESKRQENSLKLGNNVCRSCHICLLWTKKKKKISNVHTMLLVFSIFVSFDGWLDADSGWKPIWSKKANKTKSRKR